MWTALLSSFFLTALLADCHSVSHPRVQLGDTTLKGKRLQPSNLEFFGGYHPPISTGSLPHSPIQGFLLPSPQSAASVFRLQSLNIPFPPYSHSTLEISVTHAYSL